MATSEFQPAPSTRLTIQSQLQFSRQQSGSEITVGITVSTSVPSWAQLPPNHDLAFLALMAASKAAPAPSPAAPVIPAGILHPTDQRLLFLSLFVLLQASKLAAFLLPLDSALSPSTTPASVSTWAAIDAAFVLGVGALRVPRMSWTRAGRLAIIAVLVGGDWLCLGGGWRSVRVSLPTFAMLS